jgi:hypothetical protein
MLKGSEQLGGGFVKLRRSSPNDSGNFFSGSSLRAARSFLIATELPFVRRTLLEV